MILRISEAGDPGNVSPAWPGQVHHFGVSAEPQQEPHTRATERS